MGVIVKSVLVHSCEKEAISYPEASLQVGKKYVLDGIDPKEMSVIPLDGTKFYFALDENRTVNGVKIRGKCNCRKFETYSYSESLFAIGGAKAVWTLNLKKHRMELFTERRYETETVNGEKHRTGSMQLIFHVWRRQQPRVPRVDLITQEDIERAYIDGRHFYIDHIENVHDMYMQNRLDLFAPEVAQDLKRLYHADQNKTRVVDGKERKQLENKADEIKRKGFKTDPTEGRLIFPFPSDERTKGGHSE
jgi:hypothetical protein